MNTPLQQALQQINGLLKSGKPEAAAAAGRKAIKKFAKKPEPCMALAQVEQALGNSEGMFYALEQACKRAPKEPSIRAMQGDALLGARRFTQAAKAYRIGLKLQPQQVQWKIRLAAALQELPTGLDEAIKLHRQVLKATPQTAAAHYNLGTALKRQHDFEGALAAYRHAAKLAPKDGEIRFSLANLLVELEHFEEAVIELSTMLALKPGFPAALEQLAYANKKLRRPAECLQAAQALMDNTEKNARTLAVLASAQLTAGDYAAAIESCDQGLAEKPLNRRLFSDKLIALSGQHKRSESEKGRSDNRQAARHLLNLDSLLQVSSLPVPAPYGDISEFNRALMEHIDHHPTLHFTGLSHSCQGGATSNELFVEPLGPVALLQQAIAQAVAQYRQQLPQDPQHPWLCQLPPPEQLNLSGWVTRLRSQGYQQGHMHPTGWISGVYYVSLPPECGGEDQAGCIEFGRTPGFYPEGDQGEIRVVEPKAGTLVLFPAYLYHRTLPFESEQERFTMAFDWRNDDF